NAFRSVLRNTVAVQVHDCYVVLSRSEAGAGGAQKPAVSLFLVALDAHAPGQKVSQFGLRPRIAMIGGTPDPIVCLPQVWIQGGMLIGQPERQLVRRGTGVGAAAQVFDFGIGESVCLGWRVLGSGQGGQQYGYQQATANGQQQLSDRANGTTFAPHQLFS